MELRKIGKKGQMGGLENAPAIVMIIGLVFLTLATIALIGEKYGDALDTDNTAGTTVNETVTPVTAGVYLDANALENGNCGTITHVVNATNDIVISSGNYTQTSCLLQNTTSEYTSGWLVSYPYTYSLQTVASNTTTALETEVSNNSSIAGIILTISLVGIVLTILIGVFVGMGRRTRV